MIHNDSTLLTMAGHLHTIVLGRIFAVHCCEHLKALLQTAPMGVQVPVFDGSECEDRV